MEAVVNRKLFCPFTEHEKAEKADKLSSLRLRMEELEATRKKMMEQYKVQIDESDAEILSLSRAVRDGGEKRTVECRIVYNLPEAGRKRITRTDLNETWTEVMDEEDYNLFPGEDPPLELPESLEARYGFNPDAYDFEKHFIVESPDDLDALDIEFENDRDMFVGMLFVQSNYDEVKKVIALNTFSFRSNIIGGIAWYAFPKIEGDDE